MATRLKLYSQCSRAQSRAYREAHFAVLDLAGAARVKFQTLARHALTLTEMSIYKANAFEAARDVELLKNEYRTFLEDKSPILPPDDSTLQQLHLAARRLRATPALLTSAEEVVKQVNKGMNTFGAIHGA